MDGIKDMEQNTKNLFRWVGRLVKVLAFTVLVPVAIVMLDLAAMFFSTPIPDTHTELTNLADDTTFYVGREKLAIGRLVAICQYGQLAKSMGQGHLSWSSILAIQQ